MAVEFRNSLFGFNTDDVLSQVHLKDSELKHLSNTLNAKINELKEQLETLKAEHLATLDTVETLSAENSEMKKELS